MLKHLTPLNPKLWHMVFKFEIFSAGFRGLFYTLFGHVNSLNSEGILLIGPTKRSFFDPGARIVLEPTNGLSPKDTPNDFNKFHYSLGILNPIRFQNPPSRFSRFRLGPNSQLRLSGHSRIGPGFYISIGKEAEVKVGCWTYIGSNFEIHCKVGITIGERCMLSHGVTIMDYDGHKISYASNDINKIEPELDSELDYGKSGKIKILDDVWIGTNVSILKGVQIGKGAVIAAGSYVTKNVPDYCLCAGNPAKIVKENIAWNHF